MAAESASVTPIEDGAPDATSFEWGGESWELVDGFKVLRFQRILETNRLAEALNYALGEDQYGDIEDRVDTLAELGEVVEALVKSVEGSPGESRASRRSSAKRRPARR